MNSKMNFVGKSAVVTGGCSGIGFGTARNLLLQGVNKIALLDIHPSPEKLDELQKEFPGTTIIFRKTDVSNRAQVECSFKDAHSKFGSIDFVVNSAGIFDEPNVEKTVGVNLLGVIYCTQAAVELMSVEKNGRGGVIANVASTAGLDIMEIPIYTASKHGVVGFTRSLAEPAFEKVYGIKFVIICPGGTTTQITDGMSDRLYRQDIGKALFDRMSLLPSQSADTCGKLLVNAMEIGDNGSIWILDNGIAKQVPIPSYWMTDMTR